MAMAEDSAASPGSAASNAPPQAPAEPPPPTAAPSLPRRFGNYELLAEIGRGGMGVVYKARQASLGRLVALKMILAGPYASAESVQRFYVEARATAKLRHPHIVAIHEVGAHDGQHYFSMDYVEGRDLAQWIADCPFPIADLGPVGRWLKTIAEAVHYAHQQGIVHRDLKPSNILIDSAGQPRITDFGLAKRLSDSQLSTIAPQLTLTGQVLGSPNYVAPEQAAG
jgi:serine/threonine-protein kinase